MKDNQNNVHTLHPLGAGVKQLPDPPDFHSIPPQHELPQTTDRLGKMLSALGRGSKGSAASPPQVPSSLKPSENFVDHKPSSSNLDNQNNVHALHPLGVGIEQLPDPPDSHGIGSAASPPPSSLKPSENFVEHKPRTPINGISSSARPSSSKPGVTPLSHICSFILL